MDLANYVSVHLSFSVSGKLINIFCCSCLPLWTMRAHIFLSIYRGSHFLATTTEEEAKGRSAIVIGRLRGRKHNFFPSPFYSTMSFGKNTLACAMGVKSNVLAAICLGCMQSMESWMLLPQQLLARFLLLRAPCRVSYNNKAERGRVGPTSRNALPPRN